MIVLNSQAPGAPFRHPTWRRGRAALICVALATMSSACTGGSSEESKPPSQDAPSKTAITQGTGEVPPELLEILRDDLTRRASVKSDTITVVSTSEQQWPDSSMGCPQPGHMYAQAIVPGYRVVLKTGTDKYAYHTDRDGNFIVCASGLPFPPAQP